MPSKTIQGQYTAQAILQVTETGANTLTFDKLETGVSVYDKVGWVITRAEWRLSGSTLALFNGTGDILTTGLAASNNSSTIADNDPAFYVVRKWLRLDFGTAASASIFSPIYVDDYSTLPGGGLLVLPNPLYIAAQGSGLTGASTVTCRIFFQSVDLGPDDYTNLVQARQLLLG